MGWAGRLRRRNGRPGPVLHELSAESRAEVSGLQLSEGQSPESRGLIPARNLISVRTILKL